MYISVNVNKYLNSFILFVYTEARVNDSHYQLCLGTYDKTLIDKFKVSGLKEPHKDGANMFLNIVREEIVSALRGPLDQNIPIFVRRFSPDYQSFLKSRIDTCCLQKHIHASTYKEKKFKELRHFQDKVQNREMVKNFLEAIGISKAHVQMYLEHASCAFDSKKRKYKVFKSLSPLRKKTKNEPAPFPAYIQSSQSQISREPDISSHGRKFLRVDIGAVITLK